MKKLCVIFWVVLLVLLGFLVKILFDNAKTKIIKDCIVKIKVVDKVASNHPSHADQNVILSKKDLDDTLRHVAYVARQEAQNEYDKNFTTLLTILTIFGVAWPIIICLIQFKLNEKELNKIENASKQIEELDKKHKKINLAIAMSHEASMTLFESIFKNKTDINEKIDALRNFIIAFDFALNYRVKNHDKSELVHLLTYFFVIMNSVDIAMINILKHQIASFAKPIDSFVSGKEIKEILGHDNLELYKKYRKFFIDIYHWKFHGDGE